MSDRRLIENAEFGNPASIKRLLEQNIPVNYQDHFGFTALIIAASKGNLKVVQELIKAGASLDLQTKWGKTALMYAAQSGNPETVRELIKAGANLNIRSKYGETALFVSNSDKISNLINKYQIIRENIKQLQDLRSSRLTYFSIIPRDLIGLIKNELEDESSYLI